MNRRLWKKCQILKHFVDSSQMQYQPQTKTSNIFAKPHSKHLDMKISIFTFSSHTQYVKKESIVIAWLKKISPFDECSCFVRLRTQNKQKKLPSVCLSVRTYVRTCILAVDPITFEGVSGFEQNLVGVFYV